MPNERTLPTRAPTDRPTFTLLVEGEAVSKELHVVSIVVIIMVNRVSSAKMILLDGDPSTENFRVSGMDQFIPGKAVEIKAGYHSQEESIFKGVIVSHGVKTRQGKPSFLVLECRHEALKLTLNPRSAYYSEAKDSDVFEEILSNHSIPRDVESTEVTHKELVQYDCKDWDFLVSRAEANGLLVFTNTDGIAVKKPDFSSEPVISLLYGATMLEFEAQADARDQIPGVSCKAWDMTNQQMVSSEGESPQIAEQGNFDSDDLASAAGRSDLVLQHTGWLPEEELKSWADGRLLKSRMAKIRGRVKFSGFARVNPGAFIELRGVGDRFNGRAFVTGVRHELGSGTWTTDAQFGLPADFFIERPDVQSRPAGGLLPAVNGLQLGVVTRLQDDPGGEHRIQVRMPVVDPQAEGVWARVASLDAGQDRGAFFRPEIGDEVVLGFLNDDPRDPVVLGMLNSSAKPAPLTATDENHEKGFITRSGMKLLFDDEKVSVGVQTPGGQSITLSDEEGTIVLKDQHGNSITMNSEGMTIESAGKLEIKAGSDLNLEGTNTGFKASSQFKAEGSSGAELTSGGTVVVKGSVVQIN
jgi:Rhs element Vgr protein